MMLCEQQTLKVPAAAMVLTHMHAWGGYIIPPDHVLSSC